MAKKVTSPFVSLSLLWLDICHACVRVRVTFWHLLHILPFLLRHMCQVLIATMVMNSLSRCHETVYNCSRHFGANSNVKVQKGTDICQYFWCDLVVTNCFPKYIPPEGSASCRASSRGWFWSCPDAQDSSRRPSTCSVLGSSFASTGSLTP